ncbi:MAG: hypothetical protein KDC26_06305 [Armatimonadetes bacterium]|nr:hypothetical protein [Armatimonadota bacterium]
MSTVSEAIRNATESQMKELGFQYAGSEDHAMFTVVEYANGIKNFRFVTDVRDQYFYLDISVLGEFSKAGFPWSFIEKLGLKKRDLRILGNRCRVHEPNEIRDWLEERMPLIIKLLSDPRLFE